MTKRYTAADFANAQFAKHPDGRTARRIENERGTVFAWSMEHKDGEEDYCADEHLAAHGWVPVPTKPTITDSEIGAIADHKTDDWLDGFMAGYEKAGGTILEETTRERVARLVSEIVDGHGIVPVGEKVADRLISVGLVKGN